MGNRLSRIYTRTGDDGSTGLADGVRVPKHSLRVCAMGEVDELNACVGSLRAALDTDDPLQQTLSGVQHHLFDLGAALSTRGKAGRSIEKETVDALESVLDELNGALAPLKEFILPGGSEAVARAHLARTVCRRCERGLFALQREEDLPGGAAVYINRLSDLFFVIARTIGKRSGEQEVLWENPRP